MATLYNQYIYKNGAWMKIGTSSDSVTYTLSYSALTGLLTLTGSDGSTSTVTIESGSSDAITGITVNGTTVTVTDGVAAISVPTTLSAFTNDVGYITSYTETDPVFSASAAAGITATDISNWNAKSNTDEKLKVEQASQGTYYPVLSTDSNSASTKVFDTDISYNFGPALSSLSIGGTRLGRLIIKNGTTAGVRLQANGFLESIVAVNLPTTSGTLALTTDIPAQASINSTGLITYKNSEGSSLFTLQLPLYNGGVS